MELGSEYNLSLTDLNVEEDNIFNYLNEYENCYYFDSGRSALKYLVTYLKHYNKVLMPEYICESVTNCFNKQQVLYYKLRDDFSVDLSDLETLNVDNHTIIFLMHYFGSLQESSILEKIHALAEINGAIVIEDTTHSIFSKKQTIGDYMICSIRKWLPISGGGVLYFNRNQSGIGKPVCLKNHDNRRSYGMILKDMFLTTGFDCNKEYRRIFAECEDRLDGQKNILLMSDFSIFIASCVSVERLRYRRKKNYNQLLTGLSSVGIKPVIELRQHDTPLVYPIRVQNRDKLRSYLKDKNIYCAVHWPFDGKEYQHRPFAVRNSKELISLPIDQRYDDKHIDYLIKTVRQYGGEVLF